MKNKFQIKYAWQCNHEDYGEILSFLVSPQVVLSSTGNVTSYGYKLDNDYDEVVRFPAGHPIALSIISKLAKINSTQWAQPTFDFIDEEFDMDDFFKEYHFDKNYGREVTFHTHVECTY